MSGRVNITLQTFPTDIPAFPSLQDAHKVQSALGWSSFLEGRLSIFKEGYKILRKPAVLQEAWLASIEAALARKQAELNKRRESSAAERRCMASWLQLGSHPA